MNRRVLRISVLLLNGVRLVRLMGICFVLLCRLMVRRQELGIGLRFVLMTIRHAVLMDIVLRMVRCLLLFVLIWM